MKTQTSIFIAAIGLLLSGCGEVPKNSSPVDMRFELVNAGRSSVWFGPGFPVTIRYADQTYSPLRACGCGDRVCHAEGAGDGRPNPNTSAAPRPMRTEQRPGAEWSTDWDGGVLGEDCPDLHDAVGEEMVAVFCWWTNIEGTDAFSGQVADAECAEVPFVLGEDDVVRHEIDSTVEWDGETMPVVFENSTSSSLYLQTSDNCGESTFYSVAFGEDSIYPPGDLCGVCDCSDAGECNAACTEECPAPRVTEVPPNTAHEVEMRLTYPRRYQEGEGICTQVQHVPVGPLTATICYGSAVDGDGEIGQVAVPECREVEFTLHDEEVRLVVSALD